MKKNYLEPIAEVVEFSAEDVIMSSYTFGQFETPEKFGLDP